MDLEPDGVFLSTVCPAAGVVSATLLFVSPLRAVLAARAKGQIGSLNPLPYPVLLANCVSWTVYSIMKEDTFLFLAQVAGVVLSTFYTLTALRLLGNASAGGGDAKRGGSASLDLEKRNGVNSDVHAAPDEVERLSTQNPLAVKVTIGPDDSGTDIDDDDDSTAAKEAEMHARKVHWYMEVLMMVCVVVPVLLMGSLGVLFRVSSSTLETVMGYCCNTFAIGFFAAPLSTMVEVVQKRNAASLTVPLSVMITLNGSFWTAYGLAVSNLFIVVPNAIGAACGIVQCLLLLLYRRVTKI